MSIDRIKHYFPELSERQIHQFEILMKLYPEWNEKINVISRKDIENLEINHLLHSLSLAKFIKFTPGSKIMDFGCGGGLPGLPLAIMNPQSEFFLIDRTAKKLKVAEEISKAAEINNVRFFHGDAAECKEIFDFIVSRAVMPQGDLLKIGGKNISYNQRNAIPNGLITLKGGDLGAEIKNLKQISEIVPISNYFSEAYFETKKIVYTQKL